MSVQIRPLNTDLVAFDLERDGFAILDFPEPDLDKMADDIWQSLQSHFDWEPWKAGTADGVRVPDAWCVNENVRKIATNPAIIDLLSEIYGVAPFPSRLLVLRSARNSTCTRIWCIFAPSPCISCVAYGLHWKIFGKRPVLFSTTLARTSGRCYSQAMSVRQRRLKKFLTSTIISCKKLGMTRLRLAERSLFTFTQERTSLDLGR
jgi:hypothetical protein